MAVLEKSRTLEEFVGRQLLGQIGRHVVAQVLAECLDVLLAERLAPGDVVEGSGMRSGPGVVVRMLRPTARRGHGDRQGVGRLRDRRRRAAGDGDGSRTVELAVRFMAVELDLLEIREEVVEVHYLVDVPVAACPRATRRSTPW